MGNEQTDHERVRSEVMSELGRLGGLATGSKKSKQFLTSRARNAVRVRWENHRRRKEEEENLSKVQPDEALSM